MTAPADVWLTRKDVSDRMQIPVATLAQWASHGRGPKYASFGRHARYRLSDLIAWEDAQFGGGDQPVDRRAIVESRVAELDGGGDNAA